MKSPEPPDIAVLADRLMALADSHGAIDGTGRESEFELELSSTITETFRLTAAALLNDPETIIAAWADYRSRVADVFARFVSRLDGLAVSSSNTDMSRDPRFRDPAWSEDAVFELVKDAYFVTAEWIEELVGSAQGLDAATRQKVLFYTKQFVAAIAPCNFGATNPKVLRRAAATSGQSLVAGLANFLDDIDARRPSGSDRHRVGKQVIGDTVATTAGKVIFQNELMQLIQYTPRTETVWRRPLLIVPPWINKYYVLDLGPEKSFIRWAVDQGISVFVISWINPDASLSGKTFDDYLLLGPAAASSVIEHQTGCSKINILGYCLGGTLTACYLGWLAAGGENGKISSATLLTTMIDFANAGDLSVFIDGPQLDTLEAHMRQHGFLDERHMARVFDLLRPNELIWQRFIERCLLGRSPEPSDLTYWSHDGTRMPYMMHSFYLHQLYLENRLAVANGIVLAGRPIDLGRATMPSYSLAARQDHIAPWQAVYTGVRHLGGRRRFVLAGSGHVAGVINPPSACRYGYWAHHIRPMDPCRWSDAAQFHSGSWWTDWIRWLRRFTGGKVEARRHCDGPLRAREDAPGSYVRYRWTHK